MRPLEKLELATVGSRSSGCSPPLGLRSRPLISFESSSDAEGTEAHMELARRGVVAAPGRSSSQPARAYSPTRLLGAARVSIACGVAGLLPLAGIMTFVVLSPNAHVGALLWPLVVMT